MDPNQTVQVLVLDGGMGHELKERGVKCGEDGTHLSITSFSSYLMGEFLKEPTINVMRSEYVKYSPFRSGLTASRYQQCAHQSPLALK